MKVIKNILFIITTIFLVLAIAAVAVPKLFGVEFFAVVSGSMEPEIPVGSLVVAVPTDAEDIQIGDDITFAKKDKTKVTHRVISIDREKNEFTTWGIANPKDAIDAPSKYENIIGVVRFHMPVAGTVFSWFSTPYGKILSVTAILALFLLSIILGIVAKSRKEQRMAKIAMAKKMAGDDSDPLDRLLGSFKESEEMFSKAKAASDPPADNLEIDEPVRTENTAPQVKDFSPEDLDKLLEELNRKFTPPTQSADFNKKDENNDMGGSI